MLILFRSASLIINMSAVFAIVVSTVVAGSPLSFRSLAGSQTITMAKVLPMDKRPGSRSMAGPFSMVMLIQRLILVNFRLATSPFRVGTPSSMLAKSPVSILISPPPLSTNAPQWPAPKA